MEFTSILRLVYHIPQELQFKPPQNFTVLVLL